MRSRYLALAVVLSFLCFSFAFAEGAGRTITGTTQTTSRIQPVVSAIQTQVIPKLVAKGKQLFLELSQNIKKIDILSAGQKLGSLGSGNSFDITQYIGKAIGNKLTFNILDANNNTLTRDFDISQWKSLVTQAVTPMVTQAKQRLDQGIAQVSKAVLKASVDITSPNEGETWETGLPYTISWNSVGIPAANCEARVTFGCVDECSGFACIGYGINCIVFTRQTTISGKPQGSVKFTMVDSSKLSSERKEGDVIDFTGVIVTIKNTATYEEYSVVRKVKLKVGPPKPVSVSSGGMTEAAGVSTAAAKTGPGAPTVSMQEVQGSINFTDPAEDYVLWETGKTYTVSWQSLLMPNDATGTINFSCGMGDSEQNPTFSGMECFSFGKVIQENAPISGSVQFTVPNYPYSNWGTQLKPPHGKPVVMFLTAYFTKDNKYYYAQRKVKIKALP